MHRVTTVVLALIATVMSACATDGERRSQRVAGCMQCGEVTQIIPESVVSRARSPLRAGEVPIVVPRRNLGVGSGSRKDPLGLSGMGVASGAPIYHVHNDSWRSRRAEVLLKMDVGGVRRLLVEDVRGVHIGDRVRLFGNRLMPVLDVGDQDF